MYNLHGTEREVVDGCDRPAITRLSFKGANLKSLILLYKEEYVFKESSPVETKLLPFSI